MRKASTAERLQAALDEANMKPVDLANATKIAKSSISRYLAGEHEPKQKAINKMAITLNVSEMWLWGYDVPKERSVKQKENDDLVEITVRMRRDSDFLKTVKTLSKLPADKYESIKQLLSAFGNE